MDDQAFSDYYGRPTGNGKFAVGGVALDRPFRLVRLGHFGYNVYKIEESIRFYTDILGFVMTDIRDATERFTPEQLAQIKGPPIGVFTRYGSDHHAMVLFNRSMREVAEGKDRWPSEITTNQITWQCGSLGQIADAVKWFSAKQVPIVRSGRDMPGSNWHTYIADPDGNVNELYYGIEQIGWDGHSKPWDMHDRAFREAPALPQISEYQEVSDALDRGVDFTRGYRAANRPPATYDVDGILLARPFKIVRMGPVRLFMKDVAAAKRFYMDMLGFTPTETVVYRGHACEFLRTNTEHHSLALYPLALRSELGLSSHTTNFSIGLQVANYRQLRNAREFLIEKGCKVRELPLSLFPGIDYHFIVEDPDGHAVQFYHYIEQIGWDGKPRPASARPEVQPGVWPETIAAQPDSYMGEPFLGPWE